MTDNDNEYGVDVSAIRDRAEHGYRYQSTPLEAALADVNTLLSLRDHEGADADQNLYGAVTDEREACATAVRKIAAAPHASSMHQAWLTSAAAVIEARTGPPPPRPRVAAGATEEEVKQALAEADLQTREDCAALVEKTAKRIMKAGKGGFAARFQVYKALTAVAPTIRKQSMLRADYEATKDALPPCWLGLFTADGAECADPNYARQALPADGSPDNVCFPPLAGPQMISGWGIFDAATGGQPTRYGHMGEVPSSWLHRT